MTFTIATITVAILIYLWLSVRAEVKRLEYRLVFATKRWDKLWREYRELQSDIASRDEQIASLKSQLPKRCPVCGRFGEHKHEKEKS